jgi:transmembrane sensor
MNHEESNINYNDLAIKLLNGYASSLELELLRSWIAQSTKNKAEFIQIKILWMASAQVNKNKPFDTQKALLELNRKIAFKEEKTSRAAFFSIRSALKIAAALLLTFSLGSLGTFFTMKNKIAHPLDKNPIYVYAPKGSKAITILPDGTKVWLNAGSSLIYDAGRYGKSDREVTLIGEGFFKVVSNAHKPFIVNAKNIEVRALGTEFNVKAYPEENKVETTLVTGIVKIDYKNQDYSITLKPNQQVTLYTGIAKIDEATFTDPDKIDTKKLGEMKLESSPSISTKTSITDVEKTNLYTSWKDNKWIFEGEEIGKLATLLERRFNISIVFNSEELRKYRFTGTFENETVEQVMKVLKLTAPLEYEIGKGKVTLKLDVAMKLKYKKYMSN